MMIIAGGGREAGLEHMANLLSDRYDVPLSIVTFDVFQLPDGDRVLVREITETDYQPLPEPNHRKTPSTVELLNQIEHTESKEAFKDLLETGEKYGLPIRTYARSAMFTPHSNRTRMLFTVWTKLKVPGALTMVVEPSAFAEFYPISEKRALELLGDNRDWRYMTPHDVQGL